MAKSGMIGLFDWCKKHTEGYRDVNITNMSSSWKDGLAFCALLHRFRPDLIDFDSLFKENALYNKQLAFGIAEKELGIAALLDVSKSTSDRLSVMTYLSQYYSCFRHCNPEANSPVATPVVNPADPAQIIASPKRAGEESICCICGSRVHLVQRYFDNGKLYHRTCHRNDSMEKIHKLNFFMKSEQGKIQGEEKSEKAHVGSNTTSQADLKNAPSQGLAESLADVKLQTISIPSTEENMTSSVLHTDAPSFVSELLPKEKETDKDTTDKEATVIPKARTRAKLVEDKKLAPVPVAQPRSKSLVVEEDQCNYDKTLNPFETNSSSKPDATVSSTSDDDDTNPFAVVIKKADGEDFCVTAATKSQKVEGYGNPFDVEGTDDENECGDAYGDDELEEAGVGDDECGNPFGEPEEDAPVLTEMPIQVKPSLPLSQEDLKTFSTETPKKKRPAPAPPIGGPQVPATQVSKSKPPSSKKAPAPPPPSWEDEASRKMKVLNMADENDPQNQSPTTGRPQSTKKSPAQKSTALDASKTDEKRGRTKSIKTHAAPGHGHPHVKRDVKIKMAEEEIMAQLEALSAKLADYEAKGIKLEEDVRVAMDDDTELTNKDVELMQDWFKLVNEKNILVRQESELVFLMRQQRLELEHADIESQMRDFYRLHPSPNTDQEIAEEQELLKKLCKIVDERNSIVTSIEEGRWKEVEEDSALELMKLQQNPGKKKKKNKVRRIFSMKGKSKKDKDTAIDTQP